MAEINLAKSANVSAETLDRILSGSYEGLPEEITAVAALTDNVVGLGVDDPENRTMVRKHYGDAGLIELSFAMNGAALLPGIKRAMGYAVACDLEVTRRLVKA